MGGLEAKRSKRVNRFGWDYPPGVTGMEPQIAGYPPCYNCGHDAGEHRQSGTVSEWVLDNSWPDRCLVAGCACNSYEQYPPGPDPDEAYDRERDGS